MRGFRKVAAWLHSPDMTHISHRGDRRDRQEIAQIARRSRDRQEIARSTKISSDRLRSHGDHEEVAARSQDRADVAEPSRCDLVQLQSHVSPSAGSPCCSLCNTPRCETSAHGCGKFCVTCARLSADAGEHSRVVAAPGLTVLKRWQALALVCVCVCVCASIAC